MKQQTAGTFFDEKGRNCKFETFFVLLTRFFDQILLFY